MLREDALGHAIQVKRHDIAKLLLTTGLLYLVGCASVQGKKESAPFELILHKGVTWSNDHMAFDPNLPGFHVVGGIGEVILRPATKKLPEEFILTIRTSPGMPPMLESFTLVSRDTIVDSVPFGGSTTVWNAESDRQKDIVFKVPEGTYFLFEIVGTEVHVSFLPRGIALLKEECRIRWVDWFRE